MDKRIGILVSIIGGVILEVLIFYIWSPFENETHLVIGMSAGLFAGAVTFFALVGYFSKLKENKRKGEEPKDKGCRPFIYAMVVGLSMALTGLVIYAKDRRDRQDDDPSEVTGRQYLINEGWDEITVCKVYSDNESDDGKTYWVFYKDGSYIAIEDFYAKNCYIPTQYSVTIDDYYYNGEVYNARISKNGENPLTLDYQRTRLIANGRTSRASLLH